MPWQRLKIMRPAPLPCTIDHNKPADLCMLALPVRAKSVKNPRVFQWHHDSNVCSVHRAHGRASPLQVCMMKRPNSLMVVVSLRSGAAPINVTSRIHGVWSTQRVRHTNDPSGTNSASTCSRFYRWLEWAAKFCFFLPLSFFSIPGWHETLDFP
jgi:hypothetical protein